MKFVAGVDAHKDTHTIVFLNRTGREVKVLTISADRRGYMKALNVARELGGEVVWGLESTGCYANAFARQLLKSGACVYEVPGSFTKRHRQQSSRTGKSDALDAQAIAEAVLRESHRLPRYEIAVEREALRIRYDQRDRLASQRTECINRVRAAAVRLELNLPSCLRSEKGLYEVQRLIKAVKGDLVAQSLVDEVRYAIEDIQQLNDRIAEIEDLLRPLISRLAPELLAMRGVSTVTAAGLIGHAGNLKNCRNADAFAMRAGTAPVSCSSGKHSAVRVNLGGNRKLNSLLHSIAIHQIRADEHPSRVYYERKRGEGKTQRAALRALKRRLSVVVYYRLLCVTARYIPKGGHRAAA
ncbi:MAG TPA: IS110 family transposase [Candidatus Baltobacteraceae bacterium]|nr:IS110 family transposase [Candidatus Baltobacteraceae bacterium]